MISQPTFLGYTYVRQTKKPSGKLTKNYRKSSCLMILMGKIHYFDWAIFNSYVKLPEGILIIKESHVQNNWIIGVPRVPDITGPGFGIYVMRIKNPTLCIYIYIHKHQQIYTYKHQQIYTYKHQQACSGTGGFTMFLCLFEISMALWMRGTPYTQLTPGD